MLQTRTNVTGRMHGLSLALANGERLTQTRSSCVGGEGKLLESHILHLSQAIYVAIIYIYTGMVRDVLGQEISGLDNYTVIGLYIGLPKGNVWFNSNKH